MSTSKGISSATTHHLDCVGLPIWMSTASANRAHPLTLHLHEFSAIQHLLFFTSGLLFTCPLARKPWNLQPQLLHDLDYWPITMTGGVSRYYKVRFQRTTHTFLGIKAHHRPFFNAGESIFHCPSLYNIPSCVLSIFPLLLRYPVCRSVLVCNLMQYVVISYDECSGLHNTSCILSIHW